MISDSTRGRDDGPLTPTNLSLDEAAYVLIEEARIHCARLEPTLGPQSAGWFVAVHREIGLAGYFTSEGITSSISRQLRGVAAVRSASSHGTTPLGELASMTRWALRAIELALASTDCVDPIHLAHVHLLNAMELIADNDALPAGASP
jgi:hypothetical protein